MIQIHVRLSAGLAQSIGIARLVLALPEGATVADATAQLVAQHPALASKLHLALPFVAGQQVGQTALLAAGQELALLLPAAGGATRIRWPGCLIPTTYSCPAKLCPQDHDG